MQIKMQLRQIVLMKTRKEQKKIFFIISLIYFYIYVLYLDILYIYIYNTGCPIVLTEFVNMYSGLNWEKSSTILQFSQ